MKVLIVGGSGFVGSLVLPYLAARHDVTVYDRKAPADSSLAWIDGDVRDFDAAQAAMAGCDALLYMAMGSIDGWGKVENALAHLDVNVTGLYVCLRAAHSAGVRHAALTSSMSVFASLGKHYHRDENEVADAHEFYGLSKRLGEEVARAAWRQWGISVNALRLCLPRERSVWEAETVEGTPTIATEGEDVARALEAALTRRFGGFQAFTISGDYDEKLMSLQKAKAMLDWAPLARPIRQPDDCLNEVTA